MGLFLPGVVVITPRVTKKYLTVPFSILEKVLDQIPKLGSYLSFFQNACGDFSFHL
jgi:hypothetical protein